MSKKIGLFGGTFDPIHNGHLNLAREIQNKHGLDEIWFIPAHANPHKADHHQSASIEDRMAMVKLAAKGTPGFKIKDFEARRSPPSFTIDTIRHFAAVEPGNHYYLILGEDNLSGFSRWHEPEEIVRLVPLLIGSRSTKKMGKVEGSSEVLEAIRKGLTETQLMDVSATEIRQRISEGKDCSHLLPPAVLEYIRQHRLYSSW